MTIFREHRYINNIQLDVDLDINWSDFEVTKEEIKRANDFLLHRIDKIPKTFTAEIIATLPIGWKSTVYPRSEQNNQNVIEVIALLESRGSLFLETVSLTQKGNEWKGTYKFKDSRIFHTACSIRIFAIRTQDNRDPSRDHAFADEKYDIIGESSSFSLDFIEGTSSGGAMNVSWVDFSELHHPYRNFDQFMAMDVRTDAVNVYLNSKNNADIRQLSRGKTDTNKVHRHFLHRNIALPIQIIMITDIIIGLEEYANEAMSAEEWVDTYCEETSIKILENYLQYIYPESSFLDAANPLKERKKQLKDDLQDKATFRKVISQRLLLAAQEKLEYQEKLKNHAEKINR
jgi:hypothetical protein